MRALNQQKQELLVAAVAVAEALVELVYATFSVDKALLTGPERVYAGPHFNVNLGFGGVGLHDHFVFVDDFAGYSVGVDVFLHGIPRLATMGNSKTLARMVQNS